MCDFHSDRARYLDRIVRKEQVEAFSAVLLSHQKAVTPEGICIFVFFFTIIFLL